MDIGIDIDRESARETQRERCVCVCIHTYIYILTYIHSHTDIHRPGFTRVGGHMKDRELCKRRCREQPFDRRQC